MAGNTTQSGKIAVGKGAALTADAMDAAESFVRGLNLDKKTTLRMRLLTEEVLEMLKGTAEDFSGLFWLEADDAECRICIDGAAELDLAAEKSLLSVSRDGKNVSVKGFTARLTQFVRHYREYVARLNALMNLSSGLYPEDFMYIGAMQPSSETTDVMWSMNDYRKFLLDDTHASAQLAADRDELEKSIIGNLADDVHVGVKEDRIKITVIKKL